MNLVIFPLFSQPPALDAHKIAAALTRRHRGFKFSASSDRNDIFTINVNKIAVIVSPIPQPIPGDDVSGLDEFSRRGWDNSVEPESHKAHAIVVGTGGDAKDVALALTIVAGELCRVEACLGIYWGPSHVLAHKDFVVGATESVAVDAPAMWLWVNAHPYQTDDGIGLTTEGLSTFVGRELHFLPHPSHDLDDIFDRALTFSEYIYSNGLVVKDGQSLGYSETDVFRARWTEEAVESGEPLKWIELKLEASGKD
jgi:hypothetical protein